MFDRIKSGAKIEHDQQGDMLSILTGAISYKRPKSFGDSRIKIPTRS